MSEIVYLPKNFNKGESSTDGHANQSGAHIEVVHLLSKKAVKFKAFITDFSDDHQSSWSNEQVYGRMDDVSTYSATKRFVNVSFDLPSAGIGEAIENMQKVSLLKQFLYPGYTSTGNALAMSSSPLLRVRFANLIVENKKFGKGVLASIRSINFKPSIDTGFHIIRPTDFLIREKRPDGTAGRIVQGDELATQILVAFGEKKMDSYIIAKTFNISLSLNIFHEHTLGWSKCEGPADGTSENGNEYFFGVHSETQDKISNVGYYPYGFTPIEEGFKDGASIDGFKNTVIFSSQGAQEEADNASIARILERDVGSF